MNYLDVIAMGAFIVATWAACAVAAGTMLWFVGSVGYGLTRVWDWLGPRPHEAEARPRGRKHGRRTAEVATFTPVNIRRRVLPLV